MITVLNGSNAFLRQRKLKQMKEEFAEKYGSENIERISGHGLEKEQLPNLIQGGSLFSSNRMVVIRSLSVNKEVADAFLDYLEKTPEEVRVILVEDQLDKRTALYKTLKKQTDFHELEELKEPELIRWASEYAKSLSGNLGDREARMLLEFVGTDQERLAHEIEKLISYEPEISTKCIEELVERRPQSTVFQLLEYALSGQQKKASETLKSLEKAFEDPFQIANLLIWQVQVLAVVKSAGSRSDSEIAKDAKLNPYVVSKTKRLARETDKAKLNNIINQCAELDISLKSSGGSPWRLLEHTILSL